MSELLHYPRHLYGDQGRVFVVKDAAEENAALASGWHQLPGETRVLVLLERVEEQQAQILARLAELAQPWWKRILRKGLETIQ